MAGGGVETMEGGQERSMPAYHCLSFIRCCIDAPELPFVAPL